MERNTSTYRSRTNYNCDEFISTYLKEQMIIPMRYVWHVSRQHNRSSIQTKGIIKRNEYSGVFANHFKPTHETIGLMWPLPIDGFDCAGIDLNTFYRLYDFWRIDTRAYEAEWRTDPFLRNDLKAYHLRTPQDYLCSLTEIPPHALKLYRYRGEKKTIIYTAVGVAGVMIQSVLKSA